MPVRKIIHIDMDAFYASVEQRDNPALKGKPVAVGHAGPRGVVATASYEARRYGVHSAMSAARAKRLCKKLIFVPARMDVYKNISRRIHAIFHQYTEKVEPLSIDEAFLDVSHWPCATRVAQEIKERILKETGLTASAGVSVNKMLAKIASDCRKPNGLFVISPKNVQAFILRLPVEKFFGVGKVTAQKMHELGIFTGQDLRQAPLALLVRHFGKSGQNYYDYARGKDEREVVSCRVRKSLGAEETFAADSADRDFLQKQIRAVCAKVWRRKEKASFEGKTVTLKLKFADFKQITRARTLGSVVGSEQVLYDTAAAILANVALKNRRVRLLGVTLSHPPFSEEGAQLHFDFISPSVH